MRSAFCAIMICGWDFAKRIPFIRLLSSIFSMKRDRDSRQLSAAGNFFADVSLQHKSLCPENFFWKWRELRLF